MVASSLPRVALVALAFVLAACQSYPLGMSESEWNRLTPEQQLEARTKQAELSRVRAERRAERLADKRRHQAILAAEEKRRLERLYAEARYGDILECVVEGGIADFHPGWRRYRPAPFTLARGEDKYVSFQDDGRKGGRFWSRYSPDGREVTICYRKGKKARGCVTFSAMSRDFQMGVERTFTIDNAFQNAQLVCAYRPGPGMPQTVIHQTNIEIRRVIHNHHHAQRPAPVRRVVEEHHWYAPPKGPKRRVIHHRTRRGTHGTEHENGTRKQRRVFRQDVHPREREDRTRETGEESRDIRRDARRVKESLYHKPSPEAAQERRRAAPPANRRARRVAAPESAVRNDDRNERCRDDRDRKGRGHANRRGHNCRP